MLGLRTHAVDGFKYLSHHMSAKYEESVLTIDLGASEKFEWMSFQELHLWQMRNDCMRNAFWTLLCIIILQGGRDPQTNHILPKASEQPALCMAFPRKLLQRRPPTHRHPFPKAAASQHTQSHSHTGDGQDWTQIRSDIPLDLSVLKYLAYKNQKGFPRPTIPFL